MPRLNLTDSPLQPAHHTPRHIAPGLHIAVRVRTCKRTRMLMQDRLMSTSKCKFAALSDLVLTLARKTGGGACPERGSSATCGPMQCVSGGHQGGTAGHILQLRIMSLPHTFCLRQSIHTPPCRRLLPLFLLLLRICFLRRLLFRLLLLGQLYSLLVLCGVVRVTGAGYRVSSEQVFPLGERRGNQGCARGA